MRYPTVIFDLDGTLTDSGDGIMASGLAALRDMGKPEPDRETLKLMRGPSLKWSFTTLFGLTEEEAYEAIRHYRVHYKELGMRYNGMFDGALEMLETLKKAGIKAYVASAKYQRHARMVCRKMGISRRVSGVYGSGDPHKTEGKEAIIGRILAKRGVPLPAVMVGDKNVDIIAGKDCAIDTIGVAYGYAAEGELEKENPTAILDSIEHLMAYLLEDAQ